MIRVLSILAVSLCLSLNLMAQDKHYEEWYLTTKDDISIFVKEIRSPGKDTVIVVHGGFGANHEYMLDAIKGLESKFHFVLYDQRGSLLSPAPVEKLTFQNNVSDLYELATELKLKKVKLLCHSMGTLVCMEFAKLHPALVSNIVLTGSILPKAESSKSVFSDQVNKNLEFLANRPEVKNQKKYYVDNKATLTDKEKTESWRISFAEGNIYNVSKWRFLKGGKIFYSQKAAVMAETVNWNYDYRPTLNALEPTVIQGQFDFLGFDSTAYREQTKEFKKIELKQIPNAGHNSWIDNSVLFKKYLSAGLTKVIGKNIAYDTIRYAEEYHRERLALFASEPIVKGKVVFLGDSITEFGDWQKLLADPTIVNRGIAGDNTFGVLARLEDILKREPAKLFVKVGINDISQDIPTAIIASNISSIIRKVKQWSPKTKIYLHSVLPTNDNVKNEYPAAHNKNDKVTALNNELKKISRRNSIAYIDLNSIFRDQSGKLDVKYAAPDGIHLNDLAYKTWVELMKKKGYL